MITFRPLFRFRAMVFVPLHLCAIAQLQAQPIDTLFARLRGLPVDSLEARERAATDPRMKMAAISRLTGQYAFLGRPEDCMKAAIRGLELAEVTKNDTLLALANFGIGVAFTRLSDVNGALRHFNIAFDGYQQIGDSMRMSLDLQGDRDRVPAGRGYRWHLALHAEGTGLWLGSRVPWAFDVHPGEVPYGSRRSGLSTLLCPPG